MFSLVIRVLRVYNAMTLQIRQRNVLQQNATPTANTTNNATTNATAIATATIATTAATATATGNTNKITSFRKDKH